MIFLRHRQARSLFSLFLFSHLLQNADFIQLIRSANSLAKPDIEQPAEY
ncbi:hypothetical protein GCWU000342_02230 [Shuttleworthella satelles DSM 14600]|uniref:Uncharacterized protein n=1 Tax=Shuttleworthella satelles DSM 14600 TaxID=626523 RepID=C4GDQ6_9FIRM|nr:hypothetical protein GCWU000342_02230 [Shuttleworthia satelles DSM 14600]